MRCAAYGCINNAEGYCMSSDYVTINKNEQCEEYEPAMTNRTKKQNKYAKTTFSLMKESDIYDSFGI